MSDKSSILGPGGALPKLSFSYRRSAKDRLLDGLDRARDAFARPWIRRSSLAALALLLIGGAVWTAIALMPTRKPDVLNDEIDDVLGYALLTDDFNKLPLDERLAMIRELVERLKGMDSGDSALMAAFVAGIMGEAREQLEKNMTRLMIDVWDDFAKKYTQVPATEREAYLDNALIEFEKMMEGIAGVENDDSDQERIEDAKRNAQREKERNASRQASGRGGGGPGGKRMASAVGGMHERMAPLTTPAQRGRMAGFTQAMTRHLRGEDINTGKPKAPGEPEGEPPAPPAPPGGG